jgi:hypothetical protein
MKISWYDNTIHKGTQPIRVLSENIILWFENTYPTFLEDLRNEVTYNGLKKGIKYLVGENPIREIAYVDNKKTINIEETFLSYLWIVGYSIFVLYDEVVSKPVVIRNWKFTPKVQRYISDTERLFSYGLSLIKDFSMWDIENLPNPEYYDKADNEYIEKINGVFLSAINFILVHEFAHVTLGHVDLDKEYLQRGKTLSRQELIDHELAADNYSIESLLQSEYDKTNSHVIKAGILTGLTSLIFFDNTMKGETHPDPDNRIKIALESMNLEPTDNLWGVACMGFKQWSRHYGIDLNWPKVVTDYRELFYYNIDKLGDIKTVSS